MAAYLAGEPSPVGEFDRAEPRLLSAGGRIAAANRCQRHPPVAGPAEAVLVAYVSSVIPASPDRGAVSSAARSLHTVATVSGSLPAAIVAGCRAADSHPGPHGTPRGHPALSVIEYS